MMQLDIEYIEGYRRVSLITVSRWLEIEYTNLLAFIDDEYIKYLQDFGLPYRGGSMYYLTRVHVEIVIISLFSAEEAKTLLMLLDSQFVAANKEIPQ
ncbi:MAG: hypothetical protein ACSI46_16190 [Gloeotrichia echinulata DVL01]